MNTLRGFLLSFSIVFATAIATIFTALFFGEARSEAVQVSYKTKGYVLLEVKQPKHFSITIQDPQTRVVYRRLTVSKHCNSWRLASIGSTYFFTVRSETWANGQRRQYIDVKDFCQQLDRAAVFASAFTLR